MSISDRNRRNFYEKECERSGWSVREMKRQISTSLFERLLLSDGRINKEKVYELAAKGQEIAVPEDIVKDPYVCQLPGTEVLSPSAITRRDGILSNQSLRDSLG
jgi:predicted nuclease of restriction endonuclease-like (RecB) superfamily